MSARQADYYARMLASEEYVSSRASKADLIARICGPLIEKSRRAADLGCGTGLIKDELSRRFGRTIVGVDLWREFLKTRDAVAVADLQALPFPDRTFDFALCNHVYEHVSDQERFFHELRRVMMPGGSVYLTAGSRWALVEPHYRLPCLSWLPSGLADRYLRLTGRGRSYRGIRFRGYRRLTSMIRKAGFAVSDVTRHAILGNRERIRSVAGRAAASMLSSLPAAAAERLLAVASPQWFLILTSDACAAGTGGAHASG